MILKKILVFTALFLLFVGCKPNLLDIDVSQTAIKTKFTHLDSILYNTEAIHLPQMRKEISASIEEIFDYQIGYCMQIGRVNDTDFTNSILQYRSDPAIQNLEKEIATEFSNLSATKVAITDALKHLKTHLPDAKIPNQVVFQNTLFNSSAFCTEHEIGIGLDQYLGKNSNTVKQLPSQTFYDWMKEGFDKKFLERDALLSWILTHVMPETSGNLAEEIIHYGKALYITEACFPKANKNIIVRYSEADYTWANENEYSLWKYLIDENILFKTDERMNANMLKEGPFTAGLPEKGPDRLGQYLGWMMVRNYMLDTRKTVEELIDVPYNEILQKYEPK